MEGASNQSFEGTASVFASTGNPTYAVRAGRGGGFFRGGKSILAAGPSLPFSRGQSIPAAGPGRRFQLLARPPVPAPAPARRKPIFLF